MVFSCIYLSCLKSSSWNNLLWTRETPCISGLFSIRKKFIGCGVAESNRFEIQGHKNAQSIDLNTKSSRPLNRLWSKNEFTRDIVQLIILHRVNCEPCPSITTEKEWNTDRRKLSTNRCIGCLNKKKKQAKERDSLRIIGNTMEKAPGFNSNETCNYTENSWQFAPINWQSIFASAIVDANAILSIAGVFHEGWSIIALGLIHFEVMHRKVSCFGKFVILISVTFNWKIFSLHISIHKEFFISLWLSVFSLIRNYANILLWIFYVILHVICNFRTLHECIKIRDIIIRTLFNNIFFDPRSHDWLQNLFLAFNVA